MHPLHHTVFSTLYFILFYFIFVLSPGSMCLLKSLGQDPRCSVLPVSPVQSVSSWGARSCSPRSRLLVAQGTKNTHHSLASSDGLCPGWEGCNSRYGLDDSITHLLCFVLGLICTLRFLYCNLDFVLLFNPLLNVYSLCPDHVIQYLKKRSVPWSGWVPAWARPSLPLWAAAAPGGSVHLSGAGTLGAPRRGPSSPASGPA